MTGDQWYALLKLVVVLAFAAFVLYGIYRIVTRDDEGSRRDGD